MQLSEPDPVGPRDTHAAPPPSGTADVRQRITAICPYLLSEDGTWRAAEPDRRHRCTALRPPAPLTLEKQARLCLVADHLHCPAYLAAQGRRGAGDEESGARIAERATGLRPMGRSLPVALEVPRAVPGARFVARRREGIIGLSLAAAMLLGAVALIDARGLRPGGGTTTGAGPTPTASLAPATPRATTTAPPTGPSAIPTAVPPTVAPTTVPTDTPRPRTYRVKPGDTLIAIARQFGTTVAILQRLNDISDPRLLRAGQLLQLP
jgi:LysM repeat protein